MNFCQSCVEPVLCDLLKSVSYYLTQDEMQGAMPFLHSALLQSCWYIVLKIRNTDLMGDIRKIFGCSSLPGNQNVFWFDDNPNINHNAVINTIREFLFLFVIFIYLFSCWWNLAWIFSGLVLYMGRASRICWHTDVYKFHNLSVFSVFYQVRYEDSLPSGVLLNC